MHSTPALLLTLLTSTAAVAQIRHSFDPATGRDLLNYPPHRVADLQHVRLDITVPDMNTPAMQIVETLRLTPIAEKLSTLELNAVDLNIHSVTLDGQAIAYTANPGDDKLRLTFNPPLSHAASAEVRIDYDINNPAEGVVWTPESQLFPGRAASFHTQGEPESNRYWIALHDSPNERLTSEVIVTVPKGYLAVSNGKQVSTESATLPSGAAATRFHYLQDREHAPYLISLAVGKYDVVDVASFGSRLPMPVYVPVGQGGRVKSVFSRTPKMIALYERLFNQPYPWAKYAQVLVTNFAWGGMENTSNTHLFESAAVDKTSLLDGDQDGLICHELAHQWFGDFVTCKSWEHIWLNEGWATYCEALWEQYRDSSGFGRGGGGATDPTAGLRSNNDAYQYAIWNSFQQVIDDDDAEAPFEPAMVSKEYTHPDEVFDREANPYPKGGAILHMLRHKLGDKTFFTGVAAYLDTHALQPVETFQFREALEKTSGLSLSRFFDQWCYRPGIPHLKVTPTWNSETRLLDIAVEQTQKIDGYNPAFCFDLTATIRIGNQTITSTHSPVQTRSDLWSVPCEREPEMIAINADLGVLADIEVVQPAARFISQLRQGPNLAARLYAARGLTRAPGEAGIAALAAAARDSGNFYGLRVEALKSLGKLGNPAHIAEDPDDDSPEPANPDALAAIPEAAALDALRSMKPGHFSDARVRKEWIAELGIVASIADDATRKSVAPILLARWKDDASYACRAESLRALGRIKSADALDAFAKGLSTESQFDQIRQGAIDGIKLAGYNGALDQILPMLAPNHPPETRQVALHAAVALAGQDRERVFNVIAATINEAELRTRRAAIRSLLQLNDPRSRLVVEQFIAASHSISDRAWAQVQLRKLDERSAPPATPASTPESTAATE